MSLCLLAHHFESILFLDHLFSPAFTAPSVLGDADPLLCDVGSFIGAELPDRLPRKELFEAHAVARVVDRYFPEELEITEFCAGPDLIFCNEFKSQDCLLIL